MKSNLMKTLARPDSLISRKEEEQRVTIPHYYPSRQIIANKKVLKHASLKISSLFD